MARQPIYGDRSGKNKLKYGARKEKICRNSKMTQILDQEMVTFVTRKGNMWSKSGKSWDAKCNTWDRIGKVAKPWASIDNMSNCQSQNALYSTHSNI